MIDSVNDAIAKAKSIQIAKVPKLIIQALDMIVDIIAELGELVNAINPNWPLDPYCRGMSFGLIGSKILVRVANTVLNNNEKQTFEHVKESDSQKKKIAGAEIDVLAHVKKGIFSALSNFKNSLEDNEDDYHDDL